MRKITLGPRGRSLIDEVYAIASQARKAAGGGGSVGDGVQRQTTVFTLAELQAAGATLQNSFSAAAALPANARVLCAEIQVNTALTAAGLASAYGYVQSGAPYTIQSAAGVNDIKLFSVTAGALFPADLATHDVYPSEGGLTMAFLITLVGADFNALTAGQITLNVFYAIVQ